jgi:hypothetical protein
VPVAAAAVLCTRSTLPEKPAFSSIESREAWISPTSVAQFYSASRGDVAGELPDDDHIARRDIRLDLGVGANGQPAVRESDGAFDKPVDEEVFAATQLAPYLHAFTDACACIFNHCHSNILLSARVPPAHVHSICCALVQQPARRKSAERLTPGAHSGGARQIALVTDHHFNDMKIRMLGHQTASQTPARRLSRKGSTRWLLAFSLALALGTACCFAQAAPDALTIVRNASFNELKAGDGSHPFRYRLNSVDSGKSTVKEIIETRDGDMFRLLEQNGQPLSPDANAGDIARLVKLRDHPADQEKRHRKAQAEGERQNEMIKLLPEAFLYTDAGLVPGPNGPCYRLLFKPNPAYQPPDREGEVYHGMEGELWVDVSQQRMVKLDAHLVSDVNFGWGVVGQLYKGGTILVEQKDVGDHHWETTRQVLHLSGKILLIKSLSIQSTDLSDDFAPVPNDGYQAAIATLLAMPTH